MSIAPGGPKHRAGAVHQDITDVTHELCELLTSKLVASLAGVKDSSQVRKWARGELSPQQPAHTRLSFAYDILQNIEAAAGRRTAEAWAMSVNPRLGYDTPIKAIREDRFRETAAAADALLDEAFDG
jgi:hypothetical protein